VTILTGFDQSASRHYFSVASVDEDGTESLFCNEIGSNLISSVDNPRGKSAIQLLQNRPNPFDDKTSIGVWVDKPLPYKTAHIEVIKPFGTILYKTEIKLNKGMNEIWYNHQYHHHSQGLLYYRLIVDGKHVETKSMVYAY